jgi:hypothetical protein
MLMRTVECVTVAALAIVAGALAPACTTAPVGRRDGGADAAGAAGKGGVGAAAMSDAGAGGASEASGSGGTSGAGGPRDGGAVDVARDGGEAPPSTGPVHSLRGDCSSEGGLLGRTDIVFCEPWEDPNWWLNGYVRDGTKTAPKPAIAADVHRASLVTTNCISGQCLRLDMLKGETNALAVHWPLAAAGLAPEELYLRYYIRLGQTFSPTGCSTDGEVTGAGGKFPGIADTRTNADASGQCGNGGESGDGINCWSMRAVYRDCYSGTNTACATKPGSSIRYGSYLYFYRQDQGDGSSTGHGGYWDSDMWGTFLGDGGTCKTTPNNTSCGIGDGGALSLDRWYQMEMRVKMNTVGQADGIIQGWVDGVLSYEKTNMIFRIAGHDKLHARTVWLNVYKGGVDGNCSDMQVYLDQMVISLNGKPGPWNPL